MWESLSRCYCCLLVLLRQLLLLLLFFFCYFYLVGEVCVHTELQFSENYIQRAWITVFSAKQCTILLRTFLKRLLWLFYFQNLMLQTESILCLSYSTSCIKDFRQPLNVLFFLVAYYWVITLHFCSVCVFCFVLEHFHFAGIKELLLCGNE